MPKQHDTTTDKNFDDLVHRFQNNIYGRLKGKIRLAILERDLATHLDGPLRVIDVGGGQGQFSISLAKRGHDVTLCDISGEMLNLARKTAEEMNVNSVEFLHCPLQKLPEVIDQPFDIVLCHAVLEWMADPSSAIGYLSRILKKDGLLSLAFFNVNSIIYKNLLRANYYKVESNNFVGMEGSLTPINPLKIENVRAWCEQQDFEVLDYSGIRVFHDYISDQATKNRHPDAVVEMELKFSKQEPFRSLGRYIHFVARKCT